MFDRSVKLFATMEQTVEIKVDGLAKLRGTGKLSSVCRI